jgi:hypothetical protein
VLPGPTLLALDVEDFFGERFPLHAVLLLEM